MLQDGFVGLNLAKDKL